MSSNVVKIQSGASMPSDNGYVSLWRDIDKQPWYKLHKGRYTAVFVHLLISASHKGANVTYKGQSITLKSGELARSYEQLARELNQTKSDIQNAIKTFKKHGQITTKTGQNFTIIRLKNWRKFNTLSDTVSDTPQPYIECTVEPIFNTGVNTVCDTQNNNVKNNKKDIVTKVTCKNSGEFVPTSKPNVPHQKIVDLYAEILPELPQVKKLTSARYSSIRARHNGIFKGKIENWSKYFTYVKNNCSWMISGNFNITFDYLIKQSNAVAIMEGAKDDRR